MSTLETMQDESEQNLKLNNLKIEGLEFDNDGNNDLYAKVMNFCNVKLVCDISLSDLNCVRKIGRSAILVQFTTYRVRDLVYRARTKLKPNPTEAAQKSRRIWINEDLTKYRSNLLYHCRKAKQAKKVEDAWSFNGTIFVKTNGQRIVKKIYSKSDLEQITGERVVENSGTKILDDGSVMFLTAASELSNFYPVKIELERTYSCAEQALQVKKAILAKENPKVIDDIMNATEPKVMKKIGDTIKINERIWLKEAPKFLDEILTAKFKNIALQKYILATGNANLYEASPDANFGVGVHLFDPNCVDKKQWKKDYRNITGEALMRVRSVLS